MDRNKRIVFPLLVLVLFAITADEYGKWSTGYFCKIGYSFLSDQTNWFSHAISPVVTNNPFNKFIDHTFSGSVQLPSGLDFVFFNHYETRPDQQEGWVYITMGHLFHNLNFCNYFIQYKEV